MEQAGSYIKRYGLTSARRLEALYDKRGWEEVISARSFPKYNANQHFQVITWDNNLSPYQEKSVLAAFTVQIQRLRKIDPDLLRLLQVLAFFDPECIPMDIVALGAGTIRRRLDQNKVYESTVQMEIMNASPRISLNVTTPGVSEELRPLLRRICDEQWLRGALRHFEDLSLGRPHLEEKMLLHIHDLIQLVLQHSSTNNRIGRDPHYELAATLLYGAFQAEKYRPWSECERFVPHLMALVQQDHSPTSDLLAMSQHIARYLHERGRYDEPETLYRWALAAQEQQFGTDHPETLAIVDELAVLYKHQGYYEKSELWFQRALAGREQQLGSDHLTTLATVNNFAGLFERQGKYVKAEFFYKRALTGHEQQLGMDHLDTLAMVNNIAWVYQQQRKYAKAEKSFRRALAGREKQLGAEHLRTLNTVHNLAIVYSRTGHREQGKYEEAKVLFQRAPDGREKQLGSYHPSTLNTLDCLAWLYTTQGRYSEAEPLYLRALVGRKQQLCENHPDTMTTVRNLAELYKTQGRYDEANNCTNKHQQRVGARC